MELVILILIALPFLYIYYFTRKKTKIFNVYAHSTKGYAAVKDGLAWLAAPLNPLWFFHRSLWSLFFTYIVLFFIAAAIDIELYSDKEMVLFFNYASDLDWLWIVIQVIVFFLLPLIKGNDWTSKNLIKKGYFFQDSVGASTKKNAIAIVLENNTKSNYIKNNPEIIDKENDSQLEFSDDSNNAFSPTDTIWSRHYLYAWVQLITGVLFIILLLDSGDLITTIELSLMYLVGLSALVWIYKKASGLSQSRIELWYVLFTAISWILLSIYIYLK